MLSERLKKRMTKRVLYVLSCASIFVDKIVINDIVLHKHPVHIGQRK